MNAFEFVLAVLFLVFAFTIVRQFFFSVYSLLQMEALSRSTNAELAGAAAKALKEAKYHVRHAGQWDHETGSNGKA